MLILSGLLPFACIAGRSSVNEQPVSESYTVARDAEGNETEWIMGMPDEPPDELPVAQIISHGAAGEIIAEGIPYFVSWERLKTIDESEEVPPYPAAVPSGKDRKLRFLTNARAHLVIISGDAESDAAVESDKVWECSRSVRNPCERFTPEGFVEYHRIPADVLERPYISVFAMWAVPPKLVDGKFVEDGWFVSANWLFHLADE